MKTNLAQYIKQERIKQGLNYAELSRKMGYINVNRGMRRIIHIDRDGTIKSRNEETFDCSWLPGARSK